MRVANGFLVFITCWPVVQYAAVRVYDYDPWYGAGWAMYLAPSRAADVDITQADGSLLPEAISSSIPASRAFQRASVQRSFYDPTRDLERAVTLAEPGEINGIHLRTALRRFNGWTGVLGEPVVLHDVTITADSPRDPSRSPYASVVPPSAGTWVRDDEGVVLRVSLDGTGVVESGEVAGVHPGDCADFPGCVRLPDGTALPFYAEAGRGWVADCGGREGMARLRERLDVEWRDEGLTVVWRSLVTACTVSDDAVGWSLLDAGV